MSFFSWSVVGHIYHDGHNWIRELIGGDVKTICRPGIVIDSENGVHIAYSTNRKGLVYTYRSTSGRVTHAELGLYPHDYHSESVCSLAINSQGYPSIVFTNGAYDPMIAYWQPD